MFKYGWNDRGLDGYTHNGTSNAEQIQVITMDIKMIAVWFATMKIPNIVIIRLFANNTNAN